MFSQNVFYQEYQFYYLMLLLFFILFFLFLRLLSYAEKLFLRKLIYAQCKSQLNGPTNLFYLNYYQYHFINLYLNLCNLSRVPSRFFPCIDLMFTEMITVFMIICHNFLFLWKLGLFFSIQGFVILSLFFSKLTFNHHSYHHTNSMYLPFYPVL